MSQIATTNSTNPTTAGAVDAAESDFIAGGFARRSYVHSPTWRQNFNRLEPISQQFFGHVWCDGRHGYPWPLDPLHWWSRTWEYPFIAAHLERLMPTLGGAAGLDIGAAVTFFTCYLLGKGLRLTNLDYDVSMPVHFRRAYESLRGSALCQGELSQYVVGDARDTQLPGGSFDLITCVSVLEHVPQWERTIPEIHRLAAPGGYLILTFDVRRDELSPGLSIEDVGRILAMIEQGFEPLTRSEREMPADALNNENTTMPTRLPPEKVEWSKRLSRFWPPTHLPAKALRLARRVVKGAPPPPPENLAIYGGVWRKRR